MTLVWNSGAAFPFLQSPSWRDAGILHGFSGAAADFSSAGFATHHPRFCEVFATDALYLPRQVHGTTILDLRREESFRDYCEGKDPHGFFDCDGLIVPRAGYASAKSVAFGIRTADCLPVLLRDDTQIALLHAGWRGLAAGIIEEGLRYFPRGADVVIGPAAGPSRYEVGEEVIAALGARAHAVALGGGKFLLDLEASARGIVQTHVPGASIECASLCTISDARFHSFRRDGAPARSNCAFVVV